MSSGAGHTNDWGGIAQVSYLLPDQKVEPFARYDYVWFDNAFAGTEHAMHEITVGVNRYFAGHNAKFTLDVTYLPNGAPGDGGADVLVSTSTEWLLRAQFQLLL
jgi:hypothetical protein